MNEVALPALEATNPLGFLAALGVLDTLADASCDATLRWTDELVPHAIVGGISDLDRLLDELDRDRQERRDSALLGFPDNAPLPDAKPDAILLRKWFEAVAQQHDHRADSGHLCALVAEGALDRNGKAKPTHLHFTAGQQQFLEMVRSLTSHVDRERLREAVRGPWRYDSSLPSRPGTLAANGCTPSGRPTHPGKNGSACPARTGWHSAGSCSTPSPEPSTAHCGPRHATPNGNAAPSAGRSGQSRAPATSPDRS
jgi:hypothetical protein